MDKENIKQGFTNELVATLTIGARHFKIEYDSKNDTFELLGRCDFYDYVCCTGDLFTVVNRLLELYDINN